MTMRFLLLMFIGLCYCFILSAQPGQFNPQKPLDVLPPSPNSASLGKYGGVDLNLSTGMLNLNVPLYEFNSISLKLPISLSYFSSGVRVDEMAGCVGMTWNLNAGGVITRTVVGQPDERSIRIAPNPAGGQDYLVFVDEIATGTGDGAPDIFNFNFNGYSGRFILDSASRPVLLTYSNVKIEVFSDSQAQLLFKITTGDGIQYFFGGGNATELGDTYQGGGGCSLAYPNQVATAFYLASIVHPYGDTITFTYNKGTVRYISGISQGMNAYKEETTIYNCSDGVLPGQPALPDFSCPNTLETEIANLDEINSTSGAKVRFRYIGRKDLNDSLLSAIEIYQPGKLNSFKTFSLSYQHSVANGNFTNVYTNDSSLFYRYFLTNLSENDSNNIPVKKYTLNYNDIAGLPPRLSFSQDDYGFFNGKNNQGLIPVPDDTAWVSKLPSANANRSPDTSYSFKGMLTKITYPTGGSDTIVYDANTIYTHEIVYPDPSPAGAEAVTDQLPQVATNSYTFSVSFDQSIQIGSSLSLRPGYDFVTDDDARIVLTDITANVQIFSDFLTLLNNPNAQEVVALSHGHSYQLSVTAEGPGLIAGALFMVMRGDTSSRYYNKIIFGAPRVSKVITRADPIAPPMIKKYFYANITTPESLGGINPSLGGMVYEANYKKYSTVIVPCGAYNLCDYAMFVFYSMYSSALSGLYLYSSIPISYSTVVESFGENFENGGGKHNYMLDADQPAYVRSGDLISGGPMDSYSWLNGKEIYSSTFSIQNDQFAPIQEVYTHYNVDARKNKITYSYIANKKTETPCDISVNAHAAQAYYDYNENSLWQSWVYPDTVTTINYDKNGLNRIVDTVVTQYANVSHAMPTTITAGLSNGTHEIINMDYPDDLVLSGQSEVARQSLLAKHIVSPVLRKKIIKGGAQVYAQTTDYDLFNNNNVLPRRYSLQAGSNPVEKIVEFYKYDSYGKLLTQSKENDVLQTYLWGYNNMYPVAQIVNADSASVAYTSFEADGTGNWTIGVGTLGNSGGITGNNYYTLSSGATINKSGLDATRNYLVTYWARSPMTISGTTAVAGLTKRNWTFYQHTLPAGSTSVTISGAGIGLDELRLYPADAQMSTYTYTPLVGQTSACSANNTVTYYEYDGLGRLKDIKDADGNVIKTIDYHYKGQQ